jgi:hypothetical protein
MQSFTFFYHTTIGRRAAKERDEFNLPSSKRRTRWQWRRLSRRCAIMTIVGRGVTRNSRSKIA